MTGLLDPALGAYLTESADGVKMNFGKHKGLLLAEVPIEYLRWALHEIADAPELLRLMLRDELHRRQHAGVGSFDFQEDAV